MTDAHDRSARVLDPAYVEGLESSGLDDLRAKHAECVELETEVSYVRRLTQARIDILEAEIERRAKGGSLSGLSDTDLAEALKQILADDGPRRPPENTRIPQPLAPSMEITWSRGREDAVDAALVLGHG